MGDACNRGRVPSTSRIHLVAKRARQRFEAAEQQLFYMSVGGDVDETEGGDAAEESKINVFKRFKYRRLKQDPASKLARRVYELRSRNPEFRRKREKYRKEYMRKNKRDLERRAEIVRKMKKRMPPPPPNQQRTQNHRVSKSR
jgi:hypothetical protein